MHKKSPMCITIMPWGGVKLEEQFAKRLKLLRFGKDVSARDMSLSLGQSEAYINRLENEKMLPSMLVFFCICEYFDISPGEFFNFEDSPSPDLVAAMKKLNAMESEKRAHILAVIEG